MCFLRNTTNGWLGQIDPPLCLFVVAVAATAAVVDAAAAGGLTGLAAAIQKNPFVWPKSSSAKLFFAFFFSSFSISPCPSPT